MPSSRVPTKLGFSGPVRFGRFQINAISIFLQAIDTFLETNEESEHRKHYGRKEQDSFIGNLFQKHLLQWYYHGQLKTGNPEDYRVMLDRFARHHVDESKVGNEHGAPKGILALFLYGSKVLEPKARLCMLTKHPGTSNRKLEHLPAALDQDSATLAGADTFQTRRTPAGTAMKMRNTNGPGDVLSEETSGKRRRSKSCPDCRKNKRECVHDESGKADSNSGHEAIEFLGNHDVKSETSFVATSGFEFERDERSHVSLHSRGATEGLGAGGSILVKALPPQVRQSRSKGSKRLSTVESATDTVQQRTKRIKIQSEGTEACIDQHINQFLREVDVDEAETLLLEVYESIEDLVEQFYDSSGLDGRQLLGPKPACVPMELQTLYNILSKDDQSASYDLAQMLAKDTLQALLCLSMTQKVFLTETVPLGQSQQGLLIDIEDRLRTVFSDALGGNIGLVEAHLADCVRNLLCSQGCFPVREPFADTSIEVIEEKAFDLAHELTKAMRPHLPGLHRSTKKVGEDSVSSYRPKWETGLGLILRDAQILSSRMAASRQQYLVTWFSAGSLFDPRCMVSVGHVQGRPEGYHVGMSLSPAFAIYRKDFGCDFIFKARVCLIKASGQPIPEPVVEGFKPDVGFTFSAQQA